MNRTLHYKTPKSHVRIPVEDADQVVDAMGDLTPEQLEALENGDRISFTVNTTRIEAWISS